MERQIGTRKISLARGVLVIVAMLASSLAVRLYLAHRNGPGHQGLGSWVAGCVPIVAGGLIGLVFLWGVSAWSKRNGYSQF